MTFGSTFHLQYVQRLQNSHGRTPRAALQGSCYWHDESRRFSLAVHCIPPTETSKTLAEKKIGSWVFDCLGEFGWYGPGGGSSRAASPEICPIAPLSCGNTLNEMLNAFKPHARKDLCCNSPDP